MVREIYELFRCIVKDSFEAFVHGPSPEFIEFASKWIAKHATQAPYKKEVERLCRSYANHPGALWMFMQICDAWHRTYTVRASLDDAKAIDELLADRHVT